MKKSLLLVPALAISLGAGATFVNINTNYAQASNGCEATDTTTLQTCLGTTGGVVNVMNDIALTNAVDTSTTATLDLNGHTISATSTVTNADYLVSVKRGAHLTIQDSVGNGKLTTDGTTAVKMTVLGEAADGAAANLTVKSGTIEGKYFGISGNGGRHNTNITIDGGIIKTTNAGDGSGIFNPQIGTVTVNGGDISGGTGIEMRSGSLVVNGGYVHSTAANYSVVSNPNGNTTNGAGVAVAQHATQNAVSATINGGTVRGIKSFSETNPENNPADAIAKVSAAINGGVFYGPVVSVDLTDFVKGGTFDTKPTNVPEGYEVVQNADGTWTVRKKTTPTTQGQSNIKAPEDGVFGEMPSGVENGILGTAIVMLVVATIGLTVSRIRSQKKED